MKIPIILASVVVSGILLTSAYAPNTIITDTDVTTTTVNAVDVKASHHVNATNNMYIGSNRVLTTADPTGGSEGVFSSWAPIFNNTVTGSDGTRAVDILISNSGFVVFTNAFGDLLAVHKNGTVVLDTIAFGTAGELALIAQSSLSGKYFAAIECPLPCSAINNANLRIIKDGVIVQTTTLKNTVFTEPARTQVAVSPNGKYIGAAGQDVATGISRLIIFEGN